MNKTQIASFFISPFVKKLTNFTKFDIIYIDIGISIILKEEKMLNKFFKLGEHGTDLWFLLLVSVLYFIK